MKIFVISVIAFSMFFFVSCSKKDNSGLGEEIIIDEGYKTAPGGEIVINDRSLTGTDARSAGQRASRREITKIIGDNSKITTMYDGYGNKTEIRSFDNNPLLSSITARTSASGEKEYIVYAQNGTVNRLPESMFDRVLTATANDLAAAAGVFEGRREPAAPMLAESSQTPLKPMPSYKFPIQQPPAALPSMPSELMETVEPTPAEPSKQPTGAAAAAATPAAEKTRPKISSGNVD